jgi:hypothetical protein
MQLRDALANAQQAEAPPPARPFRIGDVESDFIVFHDDAADRGIGSQSHVHRSGARVPRHVGKRLLHDAVHGALDLVTAATLEPGVGEIDIDAVAPAKVRQLRLERRHESEIIERRWMQQVREIPYGAQRAVEAGERVREQIRPAVAPLEPSAGNGQLHLYRTQRLANFVVKLARDSSLFLLLSVQQSSRQPLQTDRLFLAGALLHQPAFKAGAVPKRKPSDRHTDGQRDAEHGPDLSLQAGLHSGHCLLLLDERRAIERLHFF